MFLVFSYLLIHLATSEPLLRSCEPIRVDLCTNLGYNMTGMPNLGGNDLQQEADYTLKSFAPLIQFGCSPQLKLFLCSVYVPMCTEKVTNPIGPCRGLCESVRTRCYPVLHDFGFPWPEALNCSRFPVENNHEHMCMEGPKDKGIDITAPVDPAVQKFNCARNYVWNDDGNCVPVCDSNLLFDESEKNFAEVWVTVWALICLIISLGSALTLTIGGGRVKARPLVSLALCYCMISAGWTLRMFSGRMSMSCHYPSPGDDDGDNNNNTNEDNDGLSNVNCAFVFLLIYYFGMAANAWWVSLCAWWLARVGLLWSPEKLRNLGSFLHIGAWGLPAAQTVAALVRRDVDSDYLTGTCYIGNRNNTTLLTLVLIPNLFYLTFGIFLLVLGCIYLIKNNRPSSSTSLIIHQQTAPLTSSTLPTTTTATSGAGTGLVIRGVGVGKESDFLGALCTLYIIPTFCVMASNYYEYNNRDDWLNGRRKPLLWIFLLRYLMSLFIGVSTIFWIWSMKTIIAWKSILKRLGPRKQLPIKLIQQQQPTTQTMPVLRYLPSQTTGTTTQLPLTTTTTTSNHLGGVVTATTQNSTISRHSNRSTSHSHRKSNNRHQHHLRNCNSVTTTTNYGGETII